MRAILLLLTTIVFVIAIFSAGLAVTAYLVAEPEPHRFAHLDSPDLWTSEPVAIDPGKQHYERIAAAPAIASLPAVETDSQMIAVRGDNVGEAGTREMVDGAQTGASLPGKTQELAAADPAHAEWCFDRYRSYRQEDNSYQPYSGGPRQQCQSPWTPMTQDSQASADGDGYAPQAAGEPLPVSQHADAAAQMSTQHAAATTTSFGAHEEWCHARYRSYSVDDNSYQPFDGGPRKACSSPYG